MFIEGLNSFTNLFEAVSDPRSTESHLDISEFIPGRYSPAEFTFNDWSRVWNLAPFRLFSRCYPQLEECDPQYIWELFHTAMHTDSGHNAGCFHPEDLMGIDCETAFNCPAIVTRELSRRALGFIVLDDVIAREEQDSIALVRNDMFKDVFRGAMHQYGLLRNFYEFETLLTSMEVGAREFLPNTELS